MRATKLLALVAVAGVINAAVAQQPAAPTLPATASASRATASAPKSVSLEPLKGNVLTVEELIKTENDLAMANAKAARIKAGLEVADSSSRGKHEAPTLRVTVESIAGVPGNLRTYLTANGQRYENLHAGAKVAGCQIRTIAQQCVVLEPADKGVKPTQCPTACWTGVSAAPAVAATSPADMKGPLPLPAGAPTVPFQAVPPTMPRPQAAPAASPAAVPQ